MAVVREWEVRPVDERSNLVKLGKRTTSWSRNSGA